VNLLRHHQLHAACLQGQLAQHQMQQRCSLPALLQALVALLRLILQVLLLRPQLWMQLGLTCLLPPCQLHGCLLLALGWVMLRGWLLVLAAASHQAA
jgi:hypothetical protein